MEQNKQVLVKKLRRAFSKMLFVSTSSNDINVRFVEKKKIGDTFIFFSKDVLFFEGRNNTFFCEGYPEEDSCRAFPKKRLVNHLKSLENLSPNEIIKAVSKAFYGKYMVVFANKADSKLSWAFSVGKTFFANKTGLSSQEGVLQKDCICEEKKVVRLGEDFDETKGVNLLKTSSFPSIKLRDISTPLKRQCLFAQGPALMVAYAAQSYIEKKTGQKIPVINANFYKKQATENAVYLRYFGEVVPTLRDDTVLLCPDIPEDNQVRSQYYTALLNEVLFFFGLAKPEVESIKLPANLSSQVQFEFLKKRVYLGFEEAYPIACLASYTDRVLQGSLAMAYSLGELKHGPLATIDKDVMVVSFIPYTEKFSKNIVSLKEVIARGSKVLVLSEKQGADLLEKASVPFVIVEGFFFYNVWRVFCAILEELRR